jgi:diguanylate cyclase (GGDEF)-like protein/PAS domain S-box-containing protein
MSSENDIHYPDLVDIPKLQALLDSFYQVIGVGNAVIDRDGKVLAHAGWQVACTDFHRAHPESCKRCLESDTSLAERITKGVDYAVYDCLNGLVDTASPIMVEGKHLASVFTGQFLTRPPDLAFFRAQARQFGFDETKYLAAIAQVPVIPRERVEQTTQLYARLAATLAESGMDRLRQKRATDELLHLNAELETWVNERTQALTASEERLRLALGAARQGWFDVNVQTGVVSIAPEYASMLGFDPAGFTTSLEHWMDNIHPEDQAATFAAYESALQTGTISNMVYRRKSGSGGWVWIESVGKVVNWDARGLPLRVIGIHKDITERKQMEEEIRSLAFSDPLTGLPNRRLLLDRLAQALSRARRSQLSLAIMFLDLDNFKQINDTLGHDVGDGLLKEVAVRLNACVRTGDTVSRPGGDEFIIVLSEISHADDAALVAEKIIKVISVPVVFGGHSLSVSTSIGIAVYPVAGSDDAQTLMMKADKSMYAAKRAGGSAYRFFSD